MKKYLLIGFLAFCFVQAAFAQQATTETLTKKITGTWVLQQTKENTEVHPGSIKFLPDGTFSSVGNFFGTSEGTYRTDETRSVVYVEQGNRISEWKATVSGKTLVLNLLTEGKAKRKLTFDKEEAAANANP